MKKVFFLLFVVIIAVFTACQKEDVIVSVNTETIRAELLRLPVPTKEQVQAKIAEQTLKSVDSEVFLVRILPLEEWTYEVYEDHAVKYLVYYKIDKYNYRKNFLTLKQSFDIINGEIDTDNYSIEVDGVGCRFNKDFRASITENATTMVHFFVPNDEDREILSYNSDNSGGWTQIPPIADGKWKFIVSYDNGEFEQKFPGEILNYNSSAGVILVDFQIEIENVSAKVTLEEFLFEEQNVVSITFIQENELGDWINSFHQPVIETRTDQTFAVPFDPTWMVVCTENNCTYYYLKNYFMGGDSNGVLYYKIE